MRIQRVFCKFYAFLRKVVTFLFIESPTESNDAQLSHYMMATWAKVCQAMGHDFEPYLPVVMPSLLATASAKADLSLYGEILFPSFPTGYSGAFLRQRRPGNSRARRVGDDCHGWTDLWHKNICYGGEVPGV